MGKVIEIGNQELNNRRREIMMGLMTMAMVDEWTGSNIFGIEGVKEAITPAIDETLEKFQEDGTDILELEESITLMREEMIKFVKRFNDEDDE